MTAPLDSLLQQTSALRSLARELVGDDLADDVLQEAAIQTMTAPPRRSGPVGGWVASVVRHVALKQRRADRTRRRHETDAARQRQNDRVESTADVFALRQLTEVVTSLPEPYRATILARYLREQTPQEIAATTDTPVATVKTRLQRGLAMLRERLDERADDWRGGLVAAFALRSPTAPTIPWYATTTMKILLLTALLAPFGFGLGLFDPEFWSPNLGDPTTERVSIEDPAATTPDGPKPAAPESGSSAVPAAPTVAANESPPPTSTADVPLVRLQVDGPQVFRAAFSGTRVGDLLASEDGEGLWTPLAAQIEGFWRQLDGDREDFDATRRRVLDYTGRIRVLWMLDETASELGAVQAGSGEERVFGIFALEMDGSTDLSALADDLARALRAMIPGTPTLRAVGEHSLQELRPSDGGFVTLPMELGGHVVTFFGNGIPLEAAMPRALASLAADQPTDYVPLALHVDLSRLRDLPGVQEEPVLVHLFGLQSLRSFDVALRPVADRVQLEASLGFDAGSRGVFGALLPAVDRLPEILSRVPADATPWLAMPFRIDELFRVVADTVDASGETRTDDDRPFREQLREQLGFDLDTELLDHTGGEVLVLGDLWEHDDGEEFQDGGAPPLGACLALSLRNTAAFRAGFDKLLDHFRGVVQRHETREVDGVEITRLGTWFLTGTQLAVGQDLAALAFGPEAVTQLERMVTGRREPGAATLSPTALPDAVRNVQHLAPPGWNGIGLLDLTALLGGQVALVLEAADEAWPQVTGAEFDTMELQKWFDSALPLLTEHGLSHLIAMAGHEDRGSGASRWRIRVVW